MRLKLFRRILIIRLVLTFVWDYRRIRRLHKQNSGQARDLEINLIYAKAGKRMKKTAFRLNGILVKAGQFLSMRKDLLPEAFTNQLTGLHDALPAAPFTAIRRSIEKELQQPLSHVFSEFNEVAIAAASLAQVHRAVLKDGTLVAVKILRPHIEQMAQADLDTMGLLAKIWRRFPSLNRKIDFVVLHEQFTKTISRELDERQELAHMQQFAAMLGSDTRITTPGAYVNLTTRRLLVMDFIEGAKVTEQEKFQQWHVDGRKLAATLIDIYLRQLLVYGFIHVDPHPGNMLILADGRICLIDFGMVSELNRQEVQAFRNLMQSTFMQDPAGVLHAFAQLGFLRAGANQEILIPMIEKLLDRLSGSGSQGGVPELSSVVKGVQALLTDSPMQIQAKYIFLFRGTGILVTTLANLAPHTDWLNLLTQIGPPVFMTPIAAKPHLL